ncbi:MAG: carbon-nitrogen hydrolase family protein [Alphaproteobacteria bacterium]
MANSLSAACVQMTSGPDMNENFENAASLIRDAAASGATFIATPENTDSIRFCGKEKLSQSFYADDHPGVPYFSALAKELEVHLLIGSMAVKVSDDKIANRSFLFTPNGSVQVTYDKIHLFEVQLETGEAHREADIYAQGQNATVSSINSDFTLGLSICYDVRFAYLYRDLAKTGANILCVPAAFTVPTGQAHWEILLRTRAIETGCYVIAPAQVGTHEGGRKTYGHSLIISPWGEVLSDAGEGVGFITANLNVDALSKARCAIGALNHDQNYNIQQN